MYKTYVVQLMHDTNHKHSFVRSFIVLAKLCAFLFHCTCVFFPRTVLVCTSITLTSMRNSTRQQGNGTANNSVPPRTTHFSRERKKELPWVGFEPTTLLSRTRLFCLDEIRYFSSLTPCCVKCCSIGCTYENSPLPCCVPLPTSLPPSFTPPSLTHSLTHSLTSAIPGSSRAPQRPPILHYLSRWPIL